MSQTAPQTCHLTHPGFRMLGEPFFRLSAGTKVPSMVVQLESQEAVLPLKSVAREFGVDPDSSDGQMLQLIEQALNYVSVLKFGDKLPSELYGGQASWEPSRQDQRNADSRMRQNLVRCVMARTGEAGTIKGGDTPGWEEEPSNRALLKKAISGAAKIIGGVNEEEVSTRVGTLSEEMAYIECMRRMLFAGISGLCEKLLRIDMGPVPVSRQDTVKQVQTLGRRGLGEIAARFDAVDGGLDDMLSMLKDPPPAIASLRDQRNWLFRTHHAWSAVFADWANAPRHFDDFLWKVVERTYFFLAPRFMSVQEWSTKGALAKQKTAPVTVW